MNGTTDIIGYNYSTMRKFTLSIFLLSLLSAFNALHAQSALNKDYSFVMQIPGILAMESSPAHLYVLSEKEGLAVFRTRPDTLQYLYTSSGMQKRGNKLTADVRFAYMFGNQKRLTVLEPTSLLGVYSSTYLPVVPRDAGRIGNYLYVAMDSAGVGEISLESPETVDTTLSYIGQEQLDGWRALNLETIYKQLFVLTDDHKLHLYKQEDDSLTFRNTLSLNEPVTNIFTTRDQLLGSTDNGIIYEIDGNGNLSKLTQIGGPVSKIHFWKSKLVIRAADGTLWFAEPKSDATVWQKDTGAGNYFTITKGILWYAEYEQISKIRLSTGSASSSQAIADTAKLSLKPISNRIIPYPRALLMPIEFQQPYPADQVQFTFKGTATNAQIRGQSFYWQPTATQIGNHRFTIIATSSDGQADSSSFMVDLRSFNTPPRFTPVRSMTIGVGEDFSLPIKARDPDGMLPDLIRYIGKNLPDGAKIDENTGVFHWKPIARQVGTTTFQVIATDQYGAAAQKEITITVADISHQ